MKSQRNLLPIKARKLCVTDDYDLCCALRMTQIRLKPQRKNIKEGKASSIKRINLDKPKVGGVGFLSVLQTNLFGLDILEKYDWINKHKRSKLISRLQTILIVLKLSLMERFHLLNDLQVLSFTLSPLTEEP
ncbi:CLUMA_CG004443, isoform A [Clunio marinus]|uniref:CLUMA_CG004443, isoform A n=1 Tax=Clunio marinus TaxID=568069 RepID=A0A1J1HRR6_9DIPT|nr:CLUMA_CG004443, isoform A [Clunio marinus]